MKLKPIINLGDRALRRVLPSHQPAAAGHVVHNILNGLKSAGTSIATFLNSI